MAARPASSCLTLENAVRALSAGELVALPTETVYGLAANALNAQAVTQIFSVKSRPFIDPLIVHVHSLEQLDTLVFINQSLRLLASAFWPGPLTCILEKKACIPDLVTAGLSTVAVRMPAHPIFRKILESLPFPLAAPSANPFGYVSPTLPEHVLRTLGKKIAGVVDGGACSIGIESTIIDLSTQAPRICRQGPISAEMLTAVLKTPVTVESGYLETQKKKGYIAPGMLKSHYSPKAEVILFEAHAPEAQLTEATLYFKRPELSSPHTFWLTESGNLEEAAQNLFALLQKLDAANYKRLYVQKAPPIGIGLAINDRLTRAAAK